MKRVTPEEQERNVMLVEKLIATFPRDRRMSVDRMFAGPIGLTYFSAPASSREAYHLACPGGLAQHSLNVVRNLFKLADALAPDRYDRATLAFVGLFHDFGKVGDGLAECYVPTKEEWKLRRGEPYEINRECLWMPTSERGLYILQRHGIELTSDEYLAIRLNDGQYVRENEPYRGHEPDLALLVHWADNWSSREEKLS